MEKEQFYIVGIGASAGGVEAIFEFFANISHNPGVAFIIVRHISPDAESKLPYLLKKYTPVEAKLIENGEEIVKNKIYILPPGRKLEIKDRYFILKEKNVEERKNSDIDHFFFTLAREVRARAIAVILSGTGSDGVNGLKEIEHFGGVVFVQDPGSAKFPQMPGNAIIHDQLFVMPASEMPGEIERYILSHSK